MYSLPKIDYLVYGYANARVHGMKGLLLTEDEYKELSNLKSVEGMVEYLQKTHYKKYLLDASVEYSGSKLIEYGSGSHYADIASKIKKISPDEDNPIIDAFLARWDTVNLKTVLASRKITKNFSEVKAKTIPVGSLSISVLEDIYNAEDSELMDAIKRTEFGKKLFSQSMQGMTPETRKRFRSALAKSDISSQLQEILDSCCDKLIELSFSKYLGYEDVRKIFSLYKKEVTVSNIITIERLKKSGVTDQKEIEKFISSSGSGSNEMYHKIIKAKKLEEIFPIVKKAFSSFDSEGINDLVSLEINLQKALSAEKLKMFHSVILSIGTLLGFLLLKEEEMNNLRKIAKAKEFGIAPTEVVKTLLFKGR